MNKIFADSSSDISGLCVNMCDFFSC